MKHLFILAVGFFCSYSLFGQSIDRSVVGSTGGNYTFSTGSISATVGENIIASVENTSFTILQGFQQNHYGNIAVRKVEKSTLKIWPNPVSNYLHVQLPADVAQVLYEVLDASGKLVLSGTPSGNQIDVNNLSAGYYHIKLKYNGQESQAQFVKF